MQGLSIIEIEKGVRRVISKVLMIDEVMIKNESTLSDLGGDSLAALGIISALEQEFNINISDEDAVKINSFSSAVNVLMEILKADA
ncbi:MAG: phosphopantetheine-binding protein [Nitrospirota bacterium]|nr:phosphopantetheine-binding protein [Nitrospirota bacterium]